MVELSEYVFEPLREDGEFLLYEARSSQLEAAPVLLPAPVSTRPELESIEKIEHEYSFRAELHPTWAVVPLALSQYSDQRVLVLENPGGQPLNCPIQGPMEMKLFLRFAVGLASALSELHPLEWVHCRTLVLNGSVQ